MTAEILAIGNYGAEACVIGMANHPAEANMKNKIVECDIRGTDIYVLYSDLCGKDYDKMAHLCHTCPNDELMDACSRQDYSGREIVQKYLDSYSVPA